MDDWKLPWAGGCRCGTVRIAVEAPPLMASCLPLRRLPADDRERLFADADRPEPRFCRVAGDPVIGGLHGATRHFFCPHCPTWMFTRPEGLDQFVNLRAAMLDDRRWFLPYIELWTSEALPWARTPAVRSFATEPAYEDYAELVAAFARDGARPA